MATASEISQVRIYANEPDPTTYDDTAIGVIIDDEGSVEAATARIWSEKLSSLSTLVDVTEASASRKNSQAFTNAVKMAEYWSAKAGVSLGGRAKVHRIIRPDPT